MIDAIQHLPPHLRARVQQGLKTGNISPPYTIVALNAALNTHDDLQGAVDALNELEALGVGGPAAADILEALDKAASETNATDLVWSGPEVPGLHARDTKQVYIELLSAAKQSVWVSTYVFYDGPKAFETLADRMHALPDLKVRLLLNIQRKWGDTTDANQLVRSFADSFWSKAWPGSSRPSVFYDPRALEMGRPGGVLHAKAVVVDDEKLFVTSANLTEAAKERNIEVGLLVRDRTLAMTLAKHFQVLIDREFLLPLPSA